MNTLMFLSTFAHNLSSVILVGYYLLLSLIFLPVLTRHFKGAALGRLLNDLNSRMLPWVVGTILAFMASGTYLMMVNPDYHGIGQFTNPWSIAMLVKHGLVMLMIGLGVLLQILTRIGLVKTVAEDSQFATLKPFTMALTAMSVSGVLVLLLTAFSQAL